MSLIQNAFAIVLAVAIFFAALFGGELVLIEKERQRTPQSHDAFTRWMRAFTPERQEAAARRRRAHRVLVWILALTAAGLVLLVFWDAGRLVFAKPEHGGWVR